MKMKTWVLRNKWDDNDYLEIREYTYEDALVRSLEALGFSVTEGEIEEGEEE